MIPCAYCEIDCEPTREHVIPDWYLAAKGRGSLETFNARSPVKHTRGEVVIKDVCERCNNEKLGSLDQYGKTLYDKYCSSPVFYGESLIFHTELLNLKRWLLKLCFNSGRTLNSDVTILRIYRQFILGIEPCPGDVRLYAHLITPTDFGTSPVSAARRPQQVANDIHPPLWFRLTQMRLDPSFMTEIVQRQVYIDGLCFSLFVPDPGTQRHGEELQQLVSKFEVTFPLARLITDGTTLTLEAGDLHGAAVMFPHIDQHPVRYQHDPNPEDAEFAEIMASLARREIQSVAIEVTREEIEAQDTSICQRELSQMVATCESAFSTMSRVAIFTKAFDDDPREIWEIPAARDFFRKLFKDCPYLFFLIYPECKTLEVLALCCCRHTIEGNRVDLELEDLNTFLMTGFDAMNSLMLRLAISIEVNRAITDQVLARFRPL